MAQSRSSERSYPSGGSQSHGFAGSRGSNFTSEDEQIDNLLRLFVAVDKKQSQEEVKEYFSKFGLVDHVHILKVRYLLHPSGSVRISLRDVQKYYLLKKYCN